MTFLNSLKKWFYTNNSSAAGSAARIPLLDAAGNAVGSDTYNAIAQIVRQELATILSGADQGTDGTKFPSIASGVLGSMTAANLASVLGVPSYAEVNVYNYINTAAVSQVLSTYEQTADYSICSGATGAGSECAWYGMKHSQVGELLIWCKGGILCVKITNPNTITKTFCIVGF